MVSFTEFLRQILDEHPKSCYVLDPHAALNRTVVLTEREIQKLVDVAANYQPKICWGEAPGVPMLTFLMSMGTQEKAHTPDKILLEKDPRIEAYIIQKALNQAQKNGPQSQEKIIFGLSGNPPTMDHLFLIRHLVSKYQGVYLILNAQSPLKNNQNDVPAEIRLALLTAMLQAAGIDPKLYEISFVEVQRDPPSRMIATLSLLTLSHHAPVRFTLVLGVDALLHFERWYQWERLGGLCCIRFYPRPGINLNVEKTIDVLHNMLMHHIKFTLVYNTQVLKEQYEYISEQLGVTLDLVEEKMTTSGGSSSQLRDYYASSHARDHLPANIHPVVDDEIRRRRLYGYKPLPP